MDASDVGNDVSVASAKPEMHTQAHTGTYTQTLTRSHMHRSHGQLLNWQTKVSEWKSRQQLRFVCSPSFG